MISRIPTLSPNAVAKGVSESQLGQDFRVGGWWYGVHHHGF